MLILQPKKGAHWGPYCARFVVFNTKFGIFTTDFVIFHAYFIAQGVLARGGRLSIAPGERETSVNFHWFFTGFRVFCDRFGPIFIAPGGVSKADFESESDSKAALEQLVAVMNVKPNGSTIGIFVGISFCRFEFFYRFECKMYRFECKMYRLFKSMQGMTWFRGRHPWRKLRRPVCP